MITSALTVLFKKFKVEIFLLKDKKIVLHMIFLCSLINYIINIFFFLIF